jgi:hypothetical protein
MTDQFQLDHAAGSLRVTASSWPTLVLAPDERPGWLPSPLAYGLHITGAEPLPPPGNEVLRGKLLEPVAITLLHEAGHPEIDQQIRLQHRTIPALAYPDGLSRTVDPAQAHGYEIKVVDARDYERDWNPAPLYPRLQAQAQMACGGHPVTLIVPLVVGYKTIELGQIVEEPRRSDVIEVLEFAATEFLQGLERGKLPAPDTSMSSYRALQAITDLRDERIELAGPEAEEWLAEWLEGQRNTNRGNAAKKQIDRCKAWLAAQAGSASEIVIGDTVIKRKLVEVAAHEVKANQHWRWTIK